MNLPRATIASGPRPGAASRPYRPVLQRTCACGTHSMEGACEDCKKKEQPSLQRSAADGERRDQAQAAPPIVHDVLGSSGHPLDPLTRAFFERRFAQDFSRVRVHTDGMAAASARAVHAAAYTAGSHVVFGSGQYAPSAPSGQRLLAHELTHVVQQGGASIERGQELAIDPSLDQERQAARNGSLSPYAAAFAAPGTSALLQRACLAAATCATAVGQGARTTAVTSAPAQVAKRDAREKLCRARPRKSGCTSDGHSRRAVALEGLVRSYDRDRLTLVFGIFVDMDIPSDWGAYRRTCNAFEPPLDGDRSCIFVPDALETEAAQFNNTQAPSIGGMARDEWQRLTLRKMMHETGHARYEMLHPDSSRPGACAFDDIRSELHEIAADMDEIAAFDDLLNRTSKTAAEQRAELDKAFADRWVGRARDNWKKIQCVCECADAKSFLERTADTMTLDWDRQLLIVYHSTMQFADPTWPIAPPSRVQGPGDFDVPQGDTRPA
jgi:hypothetical protein